MANYKHNKGDFDKFNDPHKSLIKKNNPNLTDPPAKKTSSATTTSSTKKKPSLKNITHKTIQKAHEAYDRDKSTEIKNVQISENLSITKDPEAGWTGTRKYINPETLEESTETLPYRNLTKKEKDTAASKRTEQRNKQFMDTDIYKEHHAKYASKGSVYNPASRKIEYRAHSKE